MFKYLSFLLLLNIMLVIQAHSQSKSNSWNEVKENGSGTLVVAYSENSPFIYNDNQGNIAGIEFELLLGFVEFIKENYNADLTLKYEHLYNFESLIDTLKNSQRTILGIASISTLEERKKDFNITNPYMPDIEVIVSSRAIGSVVSLAEFTKMVRNNRAITVTNSTFERNILELKEDFFPNINLEYVRHVDFLVDEISNSDDAWGYISLPNYLSYYKDGKDISRQRFFMVENPGLSIAAPHSSDWAEIMNEFIADPKFNPLLNSLIEKYLGKAFNEVVSSISNISSELQSDAFANREVGVLTLERELQDLKLKQSELEIDRKNAVIYLGIVGIFLVLVALFALYRVFRIKTNTNKRLFEKNQQIRAQNQQLNSLNMEKNELIGIVAHDLKNPLTSALSVAELFKDEKITEEQSEYMGLILRSLNRMNSLVAKILEIKVLESSSLKVKTAAVNLKDAAETVVSELKVQSDKKNIRVETELDEISISTDRNLLTQVLDNLVSNAIKFSNQHSKVMIRLKDSGNKIQFEIEDEGPGIMEEEQPRLFRKYQKLNAKPTGGESSTGLGLSIVKKYIEALEGRVWCESEFGQGAKFIVELNKN